MLYLFDFLSLWQKNRSDKLILDLASLDETLYLQLEMVYSAHNDGEIQGAKQLSDQERQCGGDSKPYHFAEFLQIRDSDCQVQLLEELAKGKTDLKNFKEECKAIIKKWARQVQFMKELCIPDWERAKEEYPLHTTAAAMDWYEGFNFNKSLHDVWHDHITSAKKYEELGTGRN